MRPRQSAVASGLSLESSQTCTQALEALRKLRTEKMAEVKEFKLRLDHLRTHKDTAARLRKDIDDGERQEAELSNTISDIDGKLAEINQVRAGSHAHLPPPSSSS